MYKKKVKKKRRMIASVAYAVGKKHVTTKYTIIVVHPCTGLSQKSVFPQIIFKLLKKYII